jgi:hypothetical protein
MPPSIDPASITHRPVAPDPSYLPLVAVVGSQPPTVVIVLGAAIFTHRPSGAMWSALETC